MIKRKGKSKTFNLTPKHKSFESKSQMRFDWGGGHVINCWKDFFEGYKILPLYYIKKLDLKKI